jgi:cell division transport system ATP-binding protein
VSQTTSSASRAMVEMIKVSKIYPPQVRALVDVSLTINNGEMFFLTGASGAGKTTLLKLLCNMEVPTNGLVEVAGKDIQKLRGRALAKMRQKIGVAYQDFKLLLDRTAAENIAISMEVSYKKSAYISTGDKISRP